MYLHYMYIIHMRAKDHLDFMVFWQAIMKSSDLFLVPCPLPAREKTMFPRV